MNWIRVAADMKADDAMGIVSDDCGIPRYAAVGLCVNVFGVMATKAKTGDLSTVRDSTIEEWAGWDGKRGRFAAAFRAALCTEAGMVRSWEKYNGAAIRKAENDIERKRRNRANGAKTARGRRADGAETARVDGDGDGTAVLVTEREVDTPLAHAHTKPAPAAGAAPPADVLRWVAPSGHDALRRLFAHIPEPDTWIGIFRGLSSGLTTGRPVSAARLALAVEDFVARGKHQEPQGPSPELFRGFVKRAKEPDARSAPKTPDEHKADELRHLRERNAWCRKAMRDETPEPAWAADIDAKFPDGRTHPTGAVA